MAINKPGIDVGESTPSSAGGGSPDGLQLMMWAIETLAFCHESLETVFPACFCFLFFFFLVEEIFPSFCQ